MADVSDGLLIDAARMADASGLAVAIELDAVPLSAEARGFAGEDREARLAAATAGDWITSTCVSICDGSETMKPVDENSDVSCVLMSRRLLDE